MKERYGDPPEPQPGYYSVDYEVLRVGTMLLPANNPDEALDRVSDILKSEHPDASDINLLDVYYEGTDEEETADAA
jgi:hypothetical protein